MAYSAKVIEVMIASPSDVSKERQIARQVIADRNTIHAKDRKTIIMPLGWETHSIPDTGDRPQAIINGQILKAADLLVAMFWTKIGSPTGVAESGTVEEIEEHLKAGKSAMIYFSSAPAHPDTINATQYAAVKQFKKSLQDRGLYQEYEDVADFQAKFSRHLSQKIIAMAAEGGVAEMPANIPVVIPVTARPAIPDLSEPARELLIAGSQDRQGIIMLLRTMGGTNVQANGKAFGERGSPRSEALWTAAVRQLEGQGLIEDRGGKGQVFSLTDEGFRVAEVLAQTE